MPESKMTIATLEKYFRLLYREWRCDVMVSTRLGFEKRFRQPMLGWPKVDEAIEKNFVEALTVIPDPEINDLMHIFIGINRS